jgi:hypothetical protein
VGDDADVEVLPEYLRVTLLGLQMDEDFRAADELPPADASPPPSAAEMARRLGDLGACYLYGSGAAILGEAADVASWKALLNGFCSVETLMEQPGA